MAGPNKQPLQINGCNAKVNEPKTWSDFDSVRKKAIEIGQTTGVIPHIGYMISEADILTCIDLDIKPDTHQETIDYFCKIIKYFDSFTERSTSGKGFHIWVIGDIGYGVKKNGIEIYSRTRFMICTGDIVINQPIKANHNVKNLAHHLRVSNTKSLLSSKQDVNASKAAVIPITDNQPLTEEDNVILAKALKASNDQKFKDFFEIKDGWRKYKKYPSQSEADMGLMGKLFFYQQLVYPSIEDKGQIARLFLNSSLGKRDKAKRRNYLGPMIEKAWVTYLMDKGKKALRIEHGRQVAKVLLAKFDKEQAELAANKKGI